jgi:periplasmic divalent cation tolerance protein
MKHYIVYMTAKDVSEARKLGRALLKDRLAACVNILGPMESMYWWRGVVQNEKEVVLIAKTTARNLNALMRKVLSIHSYDVPCVVALPIAKGNPAFLQWIGKETQFRRPPSRPERIR